MPAKSEAQQRLMGMALAAKRGKGHFNKKIHEIADSMSEKQLRDFAKTRHEGLPEKKGMLNLYKIATQLIKEAKPRWVKEFLRLSPQAQQRIVKHLDKERTIKGLGEGGSGIADLVVHPEHGLSVRKILNLPDNTEGTLRAALEHKKFQMEAEQYLKELAGGKGPFGHILGGSPERSYYQYADGPQHPRIQEWDRHAADYNKAKKEREKLLRMGKRPDQNIELRKNDAARELARLQRTMYKEEKLNTEGEAILKKFRKRYPNMFDMRKINIVGGKLIDFEADKDVFQKKYDKVNRYVPQQNMLNAQQVRQRVFAKPPEPVAPELDALAKQQLLKERLKNKFKNKQQFNPNSAAPNPIESGSTLKRVMTNPRFYIPVGALTAGGLGYAAYNHLNDNEQNDANLETPIQKAAKELLRGGLGDNKSDSRYNKKELGKGSRHEQEHTSSKRLAKEIAKDHLEEKPDYYSALEKAKIASLRLALDLFK